MERLLVRSETKLVNFIGKDNIPFHAVIFPAMIMGQNQPYKLVDELPANEFYNLEGRQFSKSEGWYIDLEDFFKRFTTDQIRYAIASNAPETSDSEFQWKDFQNSCNSDLLGKYGNLVNRTLVFAKNQCNGKVPPMGSLLPIDRDFLLEVRRLIDQAAECYESFKVRRASQVVMELAQLGNVYFDGKKPWQNAKNPETRQSMSTTIACCLECLKTLALISFPIIPDTASKVWKMLGFATDLKDASWQEVASSPLPTGQLLGEPVILFQKIENDQIEQEIAKLRSLSVSNEKSNSKIAAVPPIKEAVDIDDVRKLDLRVGLVLKATAVPKSKKLLQLEVDLGIEKRNIVAGISQHYDPQSLIGKKVIVVANLKPATLMGIQSQGMILAANSAESLEVVGIQDLPPGSVVS